MGREKKNLKKEKKTSRGYLFFLILFTLMLLLYFLSRSL